MRNRFWDKRIPSFIGIIIITIGIGVTTFLVKQGGLVTSKASSSEQPKNVRIANVTDESFTVSYTTDSPTTGTINYGDSVGLGQTALDNLDQSAGKVANKTIHNITTTNLSALTKYYFVIVSGKDTYTNNSSPFEVITGPKIDTPAPKPNPISGKIILPSGESPKEAIAYLTSSNSQIISTPVKSDGTYEFELSKLRTADLGSYVDVQKDSSLKFLFYGDGLSANVSISSANLSEVPVITLSNDYNFDNSNNEILKTFNASTSSFPIFETTSETEDKPSILIPKKNQNFTDTKPSFKGTAVANQDVQITIHSDENIQTTVSADSNGNWTFTPPDGLSPGEHTITIVTRTSSGILQTITQSFVVYAAEGETTPTATPTPTPVSLTSTTLTPTPFDVTLTPTPGGETYLTPTPTSPLPITGNPTIMTAGIASMLTILIGGLLFLLARGGI